MSCLIEVRKLGLAAYMKMKGSRINRVDNGIFYMETDRSLEDWEMEYLNSCCQLHDSNLVQMRKLIRK